MGSHNNALNPETTAYVFYFGINDCDTTLAEHVGDPVDKVLNAVRKLHAGFGAKHFVFMDIPPLERCPAATGRTPENKAQVIAAMDAWNRTLRAKVAELKSATPEMKVAIFSIHNVFTAVLDRPEKHGFTKEDLTKEGGAIWADEVHATPAVQEIVAKWLVEG
ncbi:hypothetical protein HDZ31DRAFT_80542 [Schizophyllum fasciatum]